MQSSISAPSSVSHYSAQQSTLNNPIPTRCEKITKIVKIFFVILVGLALFLYSPIVFLTSLVLGIIYAKAADKAINKIKQVWQAQLLIMTIGSIGCFIIGLPPALLVTTVLVGLYQGSQLYQWSTKTSFTNPAPAAL